jgi:hypothetical protein
LVVLAAFVVLAAGCSGKGGNSSESTTPTIARPQPKVESVVSFKSGTKSAYHATLDIKVKNNGAEGTIVVRGSVTQSGKTSQNETSVFLKEGEERELNLTFPLVWGGVNFSCAVQAIVP